MNAAFYVSYAALWALVIMMAVLVLLLYRHFGVMALGTLDGIQRDGLPIGDAAIPAIVVDAADQPVTWSPKPGRSTLLLFASTGCEPCLEVLPYVRALAEAAHERQLAFDVVTISPGPVDEARDMTAQFGGPLTAYAENAGGAYSAWKVRGTPFAFVVDEYGKVAAKGLANTPVRLGEIVSAAGLEPVAALLEESVSKVDRAKLPLVAAEVAS